MTIFKSEKKMIISKSAIKSLDSVFPIRENPINYTDINLKVELEIYMNESYTKIVNVSHTSDIMKSINEASCRITDEWLNDILPADEDLSINDFGNVIVTILDTETPLSFDVEIDLCSYTKAIKCRDIEETNTEAEEKPSQILKLMDFNPFVKFSSIQEQPNPEPSIREILFKHYSETYPELEAKKMANEYIESITQ
jgi:hypothetical protein